MAQLTTWRVNARKHFSALRARDVRHILLERRAFHQSLPPTKHSPSFPPPSRCSLCVITGNNRYSYSLRELKKEKGKGVLVRGLFLSSSLLFVKRVGTGRGIQIKEGAAGRVCCYAPSVGRVPFHWLLCTPGSRRLSSPRCWL